MASSILVKEGLVEGDTALTDGGGIRNEGALAQSRSAFIHGDGLAEDFLSAIGVNLYDTTALESHGEILDQLTTIGKRQGGHHKALGTTCLGRGENLFGGNIRIELLATQGMLATAEESALREHSDLEIGSICRLIFQRLNTKAVEILATLAEALVMSLPLSDGIQVVSVLVNHAGGVQDGLPQILHSGRSADTGEHLVGPSLAGDSGDAPLVLILQRVVIGLEDGPASLSDLGHLLLVDTLETVGILGHKMKHGRILIQFVLQLSAFNIGHG